MCSLFILKGSGIVKQPEGQSYHVIHTTGVKALQNYKILSDTPTQSLPLIPFAPSVLLCLPFRSPHPSPLPLSFALLIPFAPFVRFAATCRSASFPFPLYPFSFLPSFLLSLLSLCLIFPSFLPKIPSKINFSKKNPLKYFVRMISYCTFALANETKAFSTRSLKDFHKLFVEKYKKQTLQRK
jgi:hypothetical protein